MTIQEIREKIKINTINCDREKISKEDLIETNIETLKEIDCYIKSIKQEPCKDAISRKDLLNKWARKHFGEDFNPNISWHHNDLIDMILEMPSVTPTVETAEWIDNGLMWECSNCGANTRIMKKYNVPNYCPCCGKKMVK